MNTLIFATNNLNKVREVKSLLDQDFAIKSLAESGIHIDIPEPYDTLQKNAIEKAEVIFKLTKTNCFAEDSGLMVDSLNGEPGVKSARYSGDNPSFEDNIRKLLFKLSDEKHRSAVFKTVICLLLNGQQFLFEGTCKGVIIAESRGKMGFGYDPVFVPDGAEKTFAEMPLEEKNTFSHRRKAVDKLVKHLRGMNF